MTPDDLDLAVAVRMILRHPLVRDELRKVLAEVQPSSDPEGFISTAEAARRLDVTPDTVLAWIDRGTLPASRLPGAKAWRIRPGDLEAALATHAGTKPVTSAPPVLDVAARARDLAAAVTKRKGSR